MKKYLVSLSFMLMAFTCSSQALTPIVNVSVSDTFFCFTQIQCRALASHLVSGQYCDSLLKQSEQEIVEWHRLDSTNQKTICLLEEREHNYECIISEQGIIVNVLTKQVQDCNKQIRRQKWQKRLFQAGFFIMSSISFAAFIAAAH